LTRSDLVGMVKKELGVRRGEARVIVGVVLDRIMAAIARGEKVELRGIGTFRSKVSPARWGRDFRTRRALRLATGRRVSFKVSRKLRNRLSVAGRG